MALKANKDKEALSPALKAKKGAPLSGHESDNKVPVPVLDAKKEAEMACTDVNA